MEQTTNYQFRKPVRGVDRANIDDENYNWDRIDTIEHSTQTSLAPAYDSSETYNTGDVVMYEFLMYECVDDGVTGIWNPAKWTRTTAGEHGGGSDVEANPQGTPTDNLTKLGINGTIYGITGSGGGGGNVYGAFVDTNRVIQTSTSVASGTTDTYTATEDCAVHIVFVGSTNPSRAYIDGVEVETHYASQTAFVTHVLYIRRGQVFSLESGDNSTNYTVYGLTFGTQNIFTPQIYSTEERCVGVWKDNKPLYAKTWDMNVTIPSGGSWLNTGVDISYVDALVSSVIGNGGAIWGNASAINNAGTLNLVNLGSGSLGVTSVTLYYTKTTDIAGSGSFNTLGVPARHYDTTEKVVGTVEMDNGIIKPLYEKSWWLTIPNQSGGYTFPNTSMADLDQVISNEYSFNGRGMRSYTYWYAGASIVFDEHTSSGISFYFGSSGYSGSKIFYTARYTKTTD